MNAKTFAVLAALVVLSSAAFAQSFEDQLVEGSAGISRQIRSSQQAAAAQAVAVQGAPKGYARTIFCAKAPKESGLPDGLRFYTGLDAHPPVKVPRDETAAKLNDYLGSSLKDGKFHYDAWSCDTQDYWFTFDAESLLKMGPNDKTRTVKGHVRIETRGQVDWEGDLDCVANF
jgi:hypothetical protein